MSAYQDDREGRFKLQQLERENLALRRSIEELRPYQAKLSAEEVKERARNEQTKGARKQSGEAVDAASLRLRNLNSRLAAERRTLEQRTLDRDRQQEENSVTRQFLLWLQGAVTSMTAENAAIGQWLKDAKN